MEQTRTALQRIATHVLARTRFASTGRFGLRATPGGFGTPAFGDGPEVLRVSGLWLVHETGGETKSLAITGTSLRGLASFAGADLDADFSCGADTPEKGDPDAPLEPDATAARAIATWYDLGWKVMDAFAGGLGAGAQPATIQLWPEHFDAGTNVMLPNGERMNIGFSPGDAFDQEPYAYVGPWSAERHGDPSYWNAPFGAVLRSAVVLGDRDPALHCAVFLADGWRNASTV